MSQSSIAEYTKDLSSLRTLYESDGNNWVKNITIKSSIGSIQKVVLAHPPHHNSQTLPDD